MPKIKITEIQVGSRFRKKFEGVDKLAQSIMTYGLIHPIVIDDKNRLIAGERRLRACLSILKRTKNEERWGSIEVKFRKDLNELEKKELELEENIQREAFTWQEEVNAKAELHKLKQKIYGSAVKGHDSDGWKLRDTAEALGESMGTVSMDIALARGMKAFPELKKEKSKSVAFKKLKQKQEDILNAELAKRLKTSKIIATPNIIHGNCVKEMGKMETGSIDLIIADPPFGINLGEAESFKKTHNKVYPCPDDEFTILDMLDKAFAQMFRILKDDRHAYIFFGCQHYNKIKELLEKVGFQVHHIPLIWDKLSGGFPSQSVNFTSSYEPFFYCRKGGRKLNGTPRDIFSIKRVPSNKKIHPTEKPTEFLRGLIGLSSLPGEKVLDPFAGSGSTIVAAKELSRIGIGIELDNTYYNNIVKRLEE